MHNPMQDKYFTKNYQKANNYYIEEDKRKKKEAKNSKVAYYDK